MNRWVFVAFFLVFQSFFSQTVIGQSAETSIASDLTLQINDNGEGSVFQQVTFSGTNEPMGNVVVTLPFTEVEDITTAYDDGIKLVNERIQDSSDFVSLQLNFKRSPVNGQHKAIIEYVVPDAMNELKQVQIPNISQSIPVKSNVVRVMVPLTVGVVTSLGTSPQEEGLSVGSQEFVFNLDQQDSGIVLSAARDITYSLKFEQTIENDSFMPKRVYMVLPPDLHNQKAIYRDISPKPQNMRLDEEGNVIAQFLLWPRQSKDVSVSLDVSVSKLQYDFGKVKPLNNVPEAIRDRYTVNSGVWRSTDALESFVNDALPESQTSPIKIIEEINEHIITTLDSGDSNERLSVDQILKREGPFTHQNYSDLLVASLRLKDIPARLVVGKRYDPGSFDENLQDHSWVEAYTPGVGWVTVDPFYGEETDIFGISDVGKIGLFVGSSNGTLDTVLATESFSERSIFIQETKNELTTDTSQFKIAATKYMLLPGISVLRADIQVDGGVALDDIAYSADKNSNTYEFLGSLAPLESRSLFGWSLLSNAFTPSTAAVGFGSSDALSEELAKTEGAVNYLPFVVIMTIVAFLILYKWWRRKHPKVKKRTIHIDDDGDDVQTENLLDSSRDESTGSDPKQTASYQTSEEKDQEKDQEEEHFQHNQDFFDKYNKRRQESEKSSEAE